MADKLLIIVVVIGVLFVAGVAISIRSIRSTWRELYAKFGTSDPGLSRSAWSNGAFGKLRAGDKEFVGISRTTSTGILFRFERLKSFQVLLIPWGLIDSFQVSSVGNEARIRLNSDVEKFQNLSVPWREEFNSPLAN